MRKVFVVDEYASSKQNGVGTFRGSLIACLRGAPVEVNLLSFNAEEAEFGVQRKEGYVVWHIPPHGRGGFLENGMLSLSLLRLYVSDHKDHVFFVSHSPCLNFLKALKTLFPKSQRVFVIHDQGWTAPLLGNRDRLKALMTMKRLPAAERQTYASVKRYVREERRMYNMAHRVVCLCRSTHALLQEVYRVPQEKLALMHNGLPCEPRALSRVERERLRAKLGVRPSERVLLFVGRTVQAKGIHELLDAFEELWQEDQNLRLVVAGQVFRLDSFASRTPRSVYGVTYAGFLAPERLAEWYQVADLGVLPSYTEQCSYTALEMMLYRVPIVTTDGNGLGDMFADGQDALVVPASPLSLAENLKGAIRKMLSLAPAARSLMTEAAFKKLERDYSEVGMKKNYQHLLANLWGAEHEA